MEKDKISIVVPVYNASSFLSACLDSLVNQDYPGLDIICINDGSTDNTEKVLNENKLISFKLKQQIKYITS